ncbi:MAG TPA: DUF2141 domain-containing protein [Balneolales bacterium]|nr:DUF2141 domain-containing protein [Balneolales bacterium]
MLLKALIIPLIALLNTTVPVKSKHNLTVTLHGFKNTNGVVIVALFDSGKTFLKSPIEHQIIEITNKDTLSVTFDNINDGEYAVSVIHDENKNQKLDTNFLGIPKEGFGFSNNPKIRMGPATFSECKFSFSGSNENIQISMKY